jgi:hypothetical protein
VTGAQDCHSGGFEMGSNALLEEIEKGNRGEAILSRRGIAALISVSSMRSSLETIIARERGEEGRK